MLTVGIITALVAFIISCALTPVCKKLAAVTGYLDIPAGHKAHDRATPLLGGVALFAGIWIPTLSVVIGGWVMNSSGIPSWVPKNVAIHIPGIAQRYWQIIGILAAAGLLHVIGLIDDKKPLGPFVKLEVQFAAALIVTLFCGVRVLTFMGDAASIALTTLWIVALTNSFNFLDNMDGLAAGVAAICSAALALAAWGMGQWFVAAWVCMFFGACMGFLVFNFPPASIFMGDAGSLVIGFLLAVGSCLTTYVDPSKPNGLAPGVFVPLLLMAIPLYDTASVMIIRIREGRNPMVGDRSHFSHRLLRRGMGPRSAVLTIYLCMASTAIAASVLPHTRGWMPVVMLVGQTLCTLMIIALLESKTR